MKKVKNNATWRLEDQEWWQKYSAAVREEENERQKAAEQIDIPGVQKAADTPDAQWSAPAGEPEANSYSSCDNEPTKPVKNNADWRLEDQGWWKKYHAAIVEMQSSQALNGAGGAGMAGAAGSGSFSTSGSGSGSGSGICALGYGLGLI